MQIKIGKVPGRTQVLELQEGATIAEAVRQAGLDVTGHELRLNGVSTEDFNKEVADGAIVLLTPRIKGNSDEKYMTVTFKNEEYIVDRRDTVNTLLETTDWDELMEDDEVVCEKIGENWVAVDSWDTLKEWAIYDIIDKDDAIFLTEEEDEEYEGCNCGGRCHQTININDVSTTGEVVKIVVGDLEIVINKRR